MNKFSEFLQHLRSALTSITSESSGATQVAKLSGRSGSECVLNDIEAVAQIIRKAKNILVMAGAGLSTPSGIPDFRSPGSGLYDNLEKFNLPYPTAIFDIQYFMMNPKPFVSLAKELYPGVNFKPNFGHYFIRQLQEEGKLQKMYTQNIDGLERIAGIKEDNLMESHGTFSKASCTLCREAHDAETVKTSIFQDGNAPICNINDCKGIVKPDIVFFGENLPNKFWDFQNETHFSDLLIVIGTSLEVFPFAGIADAVGSSVPRVLVNRDIVSDFGSRSNDYILSGDLVDSLQKLSNALGWTENIEKLMKECEATKNKRDDHP